MRIEKVMNGVYRLKSDRPLSNEEITRNENKLRLLLQSWGGEINELSKVNKK